jgi:hypothetical protein
MNDIVIAIPTKRPPPVRTLEVYPVPDGYKALVICGPDVYEFHRQYDYKPEILVVLGQHGMGAQSALCYSESFKAGYKQFFRMDDDLEPKTFVAKSGGYYDLDEVIPLLQECLNATRTTHAGFMNGSNRYWMKDGFSRTYGLIHGGANIAVSAEDSSPYMDPTLVRGEDVYRTCAHRKRDGAVGRVQWIGFDKRQSTITAGQSSISATPEAILASREMILQRFEGMVTAEGTRFINGGRDEIINWRMKRSKWDHP